MEKKKKILATTQRLPVVGKDGCTGTKSIFCRRCRKELWIPLNLGTGHVRCPACGEIYRIGIPQEYARIPCSCGRILTAPKRLAGRYGRCPGCHRQWQIPGDQPVARLAPPAAKSVTPEIKLPEQSAAPVPEARPRASAQTSAPTETRPPAVPAVQVSASLPPIRFKCACGQPHMVEADRAATQVRCFRCGQDITVPAPTGYQERPPATTGTAASSPHIPTVVAEDGWYFQTPYAEEDWFAVLQVTHATPIADIKKACRDMQVGLRREEPRFQKIQMAKDILTRPHDRLWFELTGPFLLTMWQQPRYKKWLALHDEAIRLHQQAIQLEKERIYHKADKLWPKTARHWLQLLQNESLWEALRERGDALFDKKFTADIAGVLRRDFVDRLLVQVACQFRDRYTAENLFTRAHAHLQWIAEVLQQRLKSEPEDRYIQGIWAQHLMEQAVSQVEARQYAKAAATVRRLQTIAGAQAAVARWKEGFLPLLLPHLSAREKSEIL